MQWVVEEKDDTQWDKMKSEGTEQMNTDMEYRWEWGLFGGDEVKTDRVKCE